MDLISQLLTFLFGLCVGSFLNVLIDRLPLGKDVISGRSVCDGCEKTLRWFELIPVVSYAIQKGMCRRCSVRLSFQYPAIELLTGGLTLWLSFHYTFPFPLLAVLWITYCFLVLTIADLKYTILPDSMLVGLVIGAFVWSLGTSVSFSFVFERIVASCIGFLSIYALWFITKGRGMGFGDVKLTAVLGLLLGTQSLILALYIAFLTGAGVGVILMIRRKSTIKSSLPFGPFLIGGYVLVVLYGDVIMSWWRNMIL